MIHSIMPDIYVLNKDVFLIFTQVEFLTCERNVSNDK